MNTLITVLSYILAASLGCMFGLFLLMAIGKSRAYSGTMKVIRTDDKLVYSLELSEDPAQLEFRREVVFKVETSEESS